MYKRQEDTLVVELDPGTAFGTGTHHTTRLCITQLKKYMQSGQEVLDVGCGSGILSIIALLLGAKEASATDVDIHAVEAAVENARVNGIENDVYTVLTGDVTVSYTHLDVYKRQVHRREPEPPVRRWHWKHQIPESDPLCRKF